uniref:Uncharacterized protein n=2 Tax=Haemonchus contortus TaxID=6289 RepID=W6NDD7_HAECO
MDELHTLRQHFREAEKNEMLLHFYRDGYESRRNTIARRLEGTTIQCVTMENIPREYPFCPTDRRSFSTEAPIYLLLHIYYSAEILEACQLNLSALVADGVYDLQLDASNKTGQLYVIHGMMANPVDVPLLFTQKERANTFMTSFMDN